MGKVKKPRVSSGLGLAARQTTQEKLRSLFEMGHILPYTTSLGTSLSPITHLTFSDAFGFIRWCLLCDLISQRLAVLHKCLFHIPRNTCSLPPPAPPSPPFVRSDVVKPRSTSQEPQRSPSKWFITSEPFLSCFCHQGAYLGVQSAVVLMTIGHNLATRFYSRLALPLCFICMKFLHCSSSSDALSVLAVFHRRRTAAGRYQGLM